MKKIHLSLQRYLQTKLAGSEIEKRFPEIGRIADLICSSTVFEIQCSPISLEEVHRRLADYAKIGKKVVFLLDDRRFNQKRVSLAELFLRTQSCYFFRPWGTDFFIYDQYELFEGRKRLFKSSPLAVDLSSPHGEGFKGDFENNYERLIPLIESIEQRFKGQKPSLFKRFKNFYLRWLDRQVIQISDD